MDYSLTKEERIARRRERIVEQQRKSKGAILPQVKTVVQPRRTKSQERIVLCDDHLAKVTRDTTTLVRNVAKAAAEYEAERTSLLEEDTKRRIERLEQEGRVGAEHFKDISSKWLDMFSVKVPSELYERMVEQKNACDAIVREKDKLIDDLKMEIEAKGLKYDSAVERQEDDVRMTVDRCRDQVLLLSRCYDEDLNVVEEALIEEWTELFERQTREWDDKLLEVGRNNSDRISVARTLFDEWEKELEGIRVEKAEESRKIRLELEVDIERLEQTLQSTKAALQSNEEKLDYGCQVLRKQYEDQMKVKASQKRKMTKLKDNLAAVKLKVTESELSNKEKIDRIEHDCEQIQQKITNHQKKFRHFEKVDRKKLDELWRLNDETVRKLVKELLDIDREIHERILKIPWHPPSLTLKMDTRKDGASTTTILDDLVQTAPIYTKPLSCSSLFRVGILATRSRTTSRSQRSRGAVDRYEIPVDVRQQILRTLATKAQFLTEQRFDQMTKTLAPEEQLLVQLDAIFSALNIRSETEVESLVKYIYKNCYGTADAFPSITCGSEVESSASAGTKLPPLQQLDYSKFLKVMNEFFDRRNLIQSAALNRTRKQNVEEMKGSKIDSDWKFKCTDYWLQFSDLFPSSKERLWDAVYDGLQKLRKCVSEHSKLVDSNRRLRAHNEELKYLLSNYENSRQIQGHEHG